MRDDGIDEPRIDADPSASSDETGELLVPRRVSAGRGASTSGHPVRERLLARAAAAREEFSETADHANSGEDGLRSFTDELDRIATQAPPASPSLAVSQKELPPNVIVAFATLLGLALIAGLFAVLIHVDPRDGTPIAFTAPTSTSAPATTPIAKTTTPMPEPVVQKPQRHRVPGPWRIADSTDSKLRKIEGTVGRTSFLKAIEAVGVPRAQTFRVLSVMKDLRDFNHCNPRDQFSALVDRSTSRVVAFEYVVSKEEIYQARENQAGLLKAEKLNLVVERARVQGAIRFDRATFTASVESSGFEQSLVQVMDDALAGHSSVADLRHGDRVRVVAEEVTVLGEFERYAGIEALEVTPAKAGEKPLRVYYFKGRKAHGYFDAEGRSVQEGDWHRPVKGARITSPFNPHRMHPILHRPMPHEGTDMAVPMGTPIGAAGPGTIKFIGNAGACGNMVVIKHAAHIETNYCHMSRFEPGLKVGDRVAALQIIGYVGSTGRSTGPHLHFGVKKNGVFVDSETTLQYDSLRGMPHEDRLEFNQERSKLDALLDAIPLPPPLDDGALKAAASAAPEEPGDEIDSTDPMAGPLAAPHAVPGVPAVPAAPAASAPVRTAPTTPVAPGASTAKPRPIYMSDQDLLKTQSTDAEGEVSQ